MKNYDAIIIGSGIAGTSLAYNIGQTCPNLKTLIIDKRNPGSNENYGNRNVPEKVAKEYNLPYDHIYQGIKVGTEDKVNFKLKKKHRFINYKRTCQQFLKKSNLEYKNEEAENIQGNFLTTHNNLYKFKILIDCSGKSFFAKKILNHPLPERYWIGRTRIIKETLKDKKYFYHQFGNTEYFEDVNPLENKTLQGDWYYSKKVDFVNFPYSQKTIFKKEFKNPTIIKEFNSVIPCAPTFPLVQKNIIFLGDSFGNATTSSACGINIILKSSELLAEKIKKRKIQEFQIDWKKRYLEIYVKNLSSKFNTYHNSKILEKIKKIPPRTKVYPLIAKYPFLFDLLMEGLQSAPPPKEFSKILTPEAKLFQVYYYTLLKLRYALQIKKYI